MCAAEFKLEIEIGMGSGENMKTISFTFHLL